MDLYFFFFFYILNWGSNIFWNVQKFFSSLTLLVIIFLNFSIPGCLYPLLSRSTFKREKKKEAKKTEERLKRQESMVLVAGSVGVGAGASERKHK